MGKFLAQFTRPSWVRFGAVALLLILSAGLFVNRALENGERVNTQINRTDQKAYINYAEWMKESNYQLIGARNRMPVYPFILSLTRDLKESDEAFFEKAKVFNIGLTLGAVAIVGVVFLLSFPLHTGLNLLLFSAFFVFLFRAAYVQAEISYYLFSFLAFFVLWKLFAKPSWWWAIAGGLLLGISHLTKASILPGVLTFGVFYGADLLWCAAKTRQWKIGFKRLALTLLVLGVFLGTIFPYIQKSKEIYGHYFYNVNSTFYFWCDSWEEAKERTRAFGDRVGWPNVPADELPSAANYLKTHTPSQIIERLAVGSYDLLGIMVRSYGYYPLLLIYFIAALLLIGWRWKLCWRLFIRRPMPVLAILALFIGYYLLSAWYTQIISGNRIVLALFLPFLFTLASVITFLSRGQALPIGKFRFPFLLFVNIVVSCYLAIDIFLISTDRILRLYGGS